MKYYKVFKGDMTTAWRNYRNIRLPVVQYEVGEVTYATKRTNGKVYPQSEYAIHYCDNALSAAYWHFVFGLHENAKFCEIEPVGEVGKYLEDSGGWECFSNGVKVVREISKKEFAGICIDEAKACGARVNMFNWLDKVELGLFEGFETENLKMDSVSDIDSGAFEGTIVDYLIFTDFDYRGGINKVTPGMLDGLTVRKKIELCGEVVIEPGVFDYAKVKYLEIGKYSRHIEADLVNKRGARRVSLYSDGDVGTYLGSFLVDLNDNIILRL